MGRDMNDVLREEGPGAVRARLDQAVSFQPNGATARQQQSAELKADEPENETRAPAFTDEALALQFAAENLNSLRYVAEWSKWLDYDSTRWRLDRTLLAFDRARALCRGAAAECNAPKEIKALASAKTVAAVASLARADRRLAATVSQWDADPWALNTLAGVINLQTGTSRRHCYTDYMTKIAAVAPDPACSISAWLKFLDRITDGDAELIAFLQRMAGYSLTGLTREHALFFCYGTGSNGKTTFLNALGDCVGDYRAVASIEVFTDSKSDRHPTEIAHLHGARLVTATETEEGRRWAEAKIKALTGGEKLAARFMRQDFFEFLPQFKLVIAGNHKPGLRTVDEAIRRRVHLIPFAVQIPVAERDPDLPNKLKAEYPGIMQWMVEGCLAWQKQGLTPPAIVTSATEQYLNAEDSIAAWIEECCERRVGAWQSSASLFTSWKTWATGTGEAPGSQKRFSQKLEARGFENKHSKTGNGFVGIELKLSYETGSYWHGAD